jgi:hypothetical protein
MDFAALRGLGADGVGLGEAESSDMMRSFFCKIPREGKPNAAGARKVRHAAWGTKLRHNNSAQNFTTARGRPPCARKPLRV